MQKMKHADIRMLFLFVVGLGCILLYGSLTRGHAWGDDFAAYIMQARSLSQGTSGEFIEANRFTIERSSVGFAPVVYPWGFPALLAPVYSLFGLNLVALKVVGALSYGLFLLLLWFGFSRCHSNFGFLCFVLLFALNPQFIASPNTIGSDLPFLLFSTLGILMIGASVVEGRIVISGWGDRVLIGLAVSAAFLVRPNGVLLFVPLGLAQVVSLWSRRSADSERDEGAQQDSISSNAAGSARTPRLRPLLMHLVPYATFICVLILCSLVLPREGDSYHASVLRNTSSAVVWDHLYYYLVLPSQFYAGVPYYRMVYLATIPFAIVGAIRRFRSDYHVLSYVAVTLSLYIMWPGTQGLRFVFPVLPFYVSFVISGLETLENSGARFRSGRIWRAVCRIPVLFVICFFGIHSARAVYDNLSRDRQDISRQQQVRSHRTPMSSGASFEPAFTPTSLSTFSFIGERTDQDSVIVFFKPRLMRLMTDRRSIIIDDVDALARGDYLCLYLRDNVEHQLRPHEIDRLVISERARLVFRNRDFAVYELTEPIR